MPRSGQTRRAAMREMRREDMIERIKNSNLLTDLLKSVEQIQGLDPEEKEYKNKLDGIDSQNKVRFKLLDKVLPNLKAQEIDLAANLKLAVIDMTGIPGGESDDDADDDEEEN